MLKLVKPSEEYKESFFAAIKELEGSGAEHMDTMRPGEELSSFISRLEDEEKGINLPEGYVPASLFWLVEDGEFIGRASLRHKLTPFLEKEGGHIGFMIRPSKRKQGYGTKIMELALNEAKAIGLKKVLMTCDHDNEASMRIIEKFDGVFQDIAQIGEIAQRRYWIDLV